MNERERKEAVRVFREAAHVLEATAYATKENGNGVTLETKYLGSVVLVRLRVGCALCCLVLNELCPPDIKLEVH